MTRTYLPPVLILECKIIGKVLQNIIDQTIIVILINDAANLIRLFNFVGIDIPS